MEIEEIKNWVKEDRVLIEAIKRYVEGEMIIDRTIDLTITKLKKQKKDNQENG